MRLLSVLLTLSFVLSSCSSYVNRWHSEIDREQARRGGGYRKGPKSGNEFDLYRNKPVGQKFSNIAPIKEPTQGIHSTAYRNKVMPSTKRDYAPRTRYKSNDLYDNGNEGSLWSGAGQENYLFSRNNAKKHGDIVAIEVQSKLKKEITLELARAFPTMAKPKKDKKDNAKAAAPEAPKNEEKEADDPNKIHDRISSVVIEEINQDHLLLRGRKDVLYKKKRRLVEIQALISRRDVSDEDSVMSNSVLESTVSVLR